MNAKEMNIAVQKLTEMKEHNAKKEEEVKRDRRRETYQRAKYFAPTFSTKFRKVCKGEKINIDEYEMPEKVRWLTPKESFFYDVKKIWRMICQTLKSMFSAQQMGNR